MRAATIDSPGLHGVAIAGESPTGIIVRPLPSGAEHEVRRTFRGGFVRDRLRALSDHDLRAYESMCLEWYLTRGRAHSRVIIADGRVRGCVLVCLDGAAYDRWAQVAAARWMSTTMVRFMTGSVAEASQQFIRHRLSDGVRRRHGRLPAVFSAHARLHVDDAIDDHDVVPWMVREVDEIVRAAALPGWDAEINVPAGQSSAAFPRDHGLVVHRLRSETLSWLHARPMDRTRMARRLPRTPTPSQSQELRPQVAGTGHLGGTVGGASPP